MKAITNKQYILDSLRHAAGDMIDIRLYPLNTKRQRINNGIKSFSSEDPLCPTIDKKKRCQIGPNKCFFYSGEFGCSKAPLFFLNNEDRNNPDKLYQRQIFLSRLRGHLDNNHTVSIGNVKHRDKLRFIVKMIETDLSNYYKKQN
jgi:hypothetical protein